jgi:hypothetical protein
VVRLASAAASAPARAREMVAVFVVIGGYSILKSDGALADRA